MVVFLRFFSALTVFFLGILFLALSSAYAVPGLENDGGTPGESLIEENSQNFEQLISESELLLSMDRPIDARAKLQKALKMAPKDYRPHLMLGEYYLFNVAHFKLAYRYIRRAEQLFEAQYGSEKDNSLDPSQTRRHAWLLYLLAEAELNLDRYEDSLATLNRFESHYWARWHPGTKAWVLMKLKRMDEAITVAQSGLLQQADPRRTWNILGILLSMKGNRSLSLHAFSQAIKAEFLINGSQQISTPLNNAGEVYREIFSDSLAEASWLKAVHLPDGCDHVLPSLNLAILYIDQLRLFQAERVLQDFEACFAQRSLRQDTEHRTLLALARGRIALRSNDIDKALSLLETASQEQQWFGKIGTNENDVKFSATIAMSQALRAKSAALKDSAFDSISEEALSSLKAAFYELRAWWLDRQARKIGTEDLNDLEDLSIRNTDTMLEYPTFGNALASFANASLQKRIQRMLKDDSRKHAHSYYRLYLATNLLAHGNETEAIPIFEQLLSDFRDIDRLARAETLAKLIVAKKNTYGLFNQAGPKEKAALHAYILELFSLLPSHIRYHNFALPVEAKLVPVSPGHKDILEDMLASLLGVRFENVPAPGNKNIPYALIVSSAEQTDKTKIPVSIHLLDKRNNTQIVLHSGEVSVSGKEQAKIINEFISKTFAHRTDFPGKPIPKIPILEGIMEE